MVGIVIQLKNRVKTIEMSKEAKEYAIENDIHIVFPMEEPRQIKAGSIMQDPYTFARAYAEQHHQAKLKEELINFLNDQDGDPSFSHANPSIIEEYLNKLKK